MQQTILPYEDMPVGALVSKAPDQFVTFTCGDRAFGIDIMAVREIRSWAPVTELPNQPFGAKGVLDIRGSIIQVYDLLAMIGGYGGGNDEGAAQVVLVVSLKSQDVGLLVDTVSDIIFAKGDDMRTAPGSGRGGGSSTVGGLVKNEDRLIAILDLKALFPAEYAD